MLSFIKYIDYWTFKRLNILNMVRQCLTYPSEDINITKRLKTPEEVEQYFPGFMAFIDSTEQQIPDL